MAADNVHFTSINLEAKAAYFPGLYTSVTYAGSTEAVVSSRAARYPHCKNKDDAYYRRVARALRRSRRNSGKG